MSYGLPVDVAGMFSKGSQQIVAAGGIELILDPCERSQAWKRTTRTKVVWGEFIRGNGYQELFARNLGIDA